MNDELENVSLEPEKPKDKIVKFFSGEGDDVEEIIKRETLTDKVALCYQWEKTITDLQKNVDELRKDIKKQTDAENLPRGRHVKPFDERSVILTKKAGSVSILWEEFVADQMKPETVKELKDIADQVKAGKVTSKYVKIGKESTSMEIV